MRYCFAVLSLCLPLAAGAEQFDLVCTNTDDMGPQEDVTLRIDTDQSTVNGHSAKITDSMISFDRPVSEGSTLTIVINRYTGSLQATYSGPPSPGRRPLHGKCTGRLKSQF
jgi:hypothetical protein